MRSMTPPTARRVAPTSPRKMHAPVEYSRFLQERCGVPKDEADRRAGVVSDDRWSFATVVFCVTAVLLTFTWLASRAWS